MAADPPRWRAARADDAEGIAELAAAALGAYGEAAELYTERIALAPDGCLALDRAGELLGHFISHPWRRGDVPALHAKLGAIPADADSWYVHDVVISPDARGGGFAAAALEMVSAAARVHGIERLSLIAVGGADGYWGRLGFTPGPHVTALPDAVYMERAV